MTPLERDLLNLVQREFPLEIRPYKRLADRLGITEQECIALLRTFAEKGILRAIRPVVAWSKLGFSSVLVGMEVDEPFIGEVAREVNLLEGVTHNYRRDAPLNLWFTLTYEDAAEKRAALERLLNLAGVKRLREFPSEKTYKIGLVLDV